jgi:hypothetical protein
MDDSPERIPQRLKYRLIHFYITKLILISFVLLLQVINQNHFYITKLILISFVLLLQVINQNHFCIINLVLV